MKVLILITGLNTGGAERFLLKILPHVDFDFKLVSILGGGSLVSEFESRGVPVTSLCETSEFTWKSVARFRRIIKDYNPDTLLTYLLHADLFGRFFGRLFGVKKIVCSIRNDNSSFRFLNFLDIVTSPLVSLYLPNSPAVKDFLVHKNGITSSKVKVVENCLDVEELDPQASLDTESLRSQLGVSSGTLIYTCVARLKKQKDHMTLLRAFAQVSKGVLVLIGEGDCRRDLETEAENLGISSKVYFLGDRKDVPSLVSQSDIFVLPSLTEGMSNALMEAMALGKPCIVSNIKQNKVLIKNKENGLTFRVGNPKDLAKKMQELSSSKKLRSHYGQKSRKLIKEKYGVKSIAQKLEKALK